MYWEKHNASLFRDCSLTDWSQSKVNKSERIIYSRNSIHRIHLRVYQHIFRMRTLSIANSLLSSTLPIRGKILSRQKTVCQKICRPSVKVDARFDIPYPSQRVLQLENSPRMDMRVGLFYRESTRELSVSRECIDMDYI